MSAADEEEQRLRADAATGDPEALLRLGVRLDRTPEGVECWRRAAGGEGAARRGCARASSMRISYAGGRDLPEKSGGALVATDGVMTTTQIRTQAGHGVLWLILAVVTATMVLMTAVPFFAMLQR